MSKLDKATPTPDRLLTIQDVSDRCQVATKTVRRWIKGNELAAFRLGRQWRISEKDLKHFLRERWNG